MPQLRTVSDLLQALKEIDETAFTVEHFRYIARESASVIHQYIALVDTRNLAVSQLVAERDRLLQMVNATQTGPQHVTQRMPVYNPTGMSAIAPDDDDDDSPRRESKEEKSLMYTGIPGVYL